MKREVSEFHEELETELGCHLPDLQVLRCCKEGHIYHLYRFRDSTTNAIEGFNRQLRKVTKAKTVFPTDDSLLKMLYLATMDITKKWTGHWQDWGKIHSQLEIYFEERLAGRNL